MKCKEVWRVKLCIVSLALLVLCLSAVPAASQSFYSNGPINGTTDAWTINFGFVVSDTFSSGGAGVVIGLSFGAWLFQGDVLESAEVSITSSEFGGTTLYRSDRQLHSKRLLGQPVWLQCLHGDRLADSGQPGRRDVLAEPGQRGGPMATRFTGTRTPVRHSASENSVGTIPSEAFTVLAKHDNLQHLGT